MKGARNMCTRCGTIILKSSFTDPYLCRWCNIETDIKDMYARLDA